MSHTRKLKLLIVDDHAGFRSAIKPMFDSVDIEILEASSGEQAVEVFTAQSPDWVVMDMRMPGIGGLKATEAIRKVNSRARVVLISQFSGNEYADLAQRAGALEFVNKEDMPHVMDLIFQDTL